MPDFLAMAGVIVGNSPDPGPLTIEKLRAAQRLLARAAPPLAELPLRRIIVSAEATKRGDRLFPPSRHRSRRIWKKLVKRHGGEFRLLPAMYKLGENMVVHPALAAEVEREFARPQRVDPLSGLLTGVPMIWPRGKFPHG